MLRPAVPLLLALACGPALAAAATTQDAGLVIVAEHQSFDPSAGELILRGHPSVQDGGTLLTADEIDYFRPTETIVATGHATLTAAAPGNRGMRLLADSFVYRRSDGSFSAQNVRVGQQPFFVAGASAQGTVRQIVVYQAVVSYTEPGRWKPTIKAESIIFTPGHFIRLGNSRIGVAGLPMIPLWHVAKAIDRSAAMSYLSFTGGYRSTLGAIGSAALRIPVADGVRVGDDLSFFTSRGVMLGPAGSYQVSGADSSWVGSLNSGWIYDYGKRYTDILGNPVPHDRAFIAWQQQAQVTDDLTLDGEVNWWSDSEVVRDFYPKQFYNVQEPDNYLEADYTGQDYVASAFTRFQPDSYEPVQERLPELQFDLLPTAIGGGFYERSEEDAVSLLERPPGGGQELGSDRLSLFYGLSRPMTDGGWLDFTPVVGGLVTNYSDTTGAELPGGYTRTLGEVGFDAQLHASGTFDYQNKEWDIDGLRHLVTPFVSYRYIPGADAGQEYIPEIDRLTFTPDLEPIELGDMRYFDTLQSLNTLRFGVDNTLQTRDAGYGSRDLATLDFTEDENFRALSYEPQGFSQLHTDASLSPASWLDITATTITHWDSFDPHEFESGFTVKDGDAWSLHLGSDFLRHEDDDYIAEYRVRLNEVYALDLLAEYDARLSLFPTRAVVLEQNLVNTWSIKYILTVNSGPNPTGHFGFNVELNLVQY